MQDGASMPVTATLEEMFNAPILQLPMSQASDMQNLANERMRLKNLGKGCNVMWRFLEVCTNSTTFTLLVNRMAHARYHMSEVLKHAMNILAHRPCTVEASLRN